MEQGSFCRRWLHGVRRLISRSDWERVAGPDWAERIMQLEVTDRFHAKQGRSTGRLILERDGERVAVYLKRHYQLPRRLGLLAALCPNGEWSPAMQEARHLQWAKSQGIPVPEVVAVGEFLDSWGRLQSFLAVEELHDMLPLNEAIPLAAAQLNPFDFRRWKRSLIEEMARLTRLLHDKSYFHKDLYLCHFYIARSDTGRLPSWHDRVYLIDLHRLGHHPWTHYFWQTKDLAQLLYSSQVPGVTERDRLHFWRVYLGEDWRKNKGRRLRWFVELRQRRYTRHNARRQRKEQAA